MLLLSHDTAMQHDCSNNDEDKLLIQYEPLDRFIVRSEVNVIHKSALEIQESWIREESMYEETVESLTTDGTRATIPN